MECTKIGNGGSYGVMIRRGMLETPTVPEFGGHLRTTSLFMNSNHRDCNRFTAGRISASASAAEIARTERKSRSRRNEEGDQNIEATVREKLDGWMREAVDDIVRNLGEAPLIVRVYAEANGKVTSTVARAAEEWPLVKERWERGEEEMPEGMIFVEQMEEDADGGGNVTDGGGRTRAWGLVVQGRGVDSGPVCYLLKTSRVGSGSGLGMWCTHFCLVRVKSFGETFESQLRKCWLLQNFPCGT